MFDSIRISIALLPIAMYWMVIGFLRFRSHPTILSRALDFLLLGMACVGLVAVGPLELFFPRAAFSVVGNWVWLVLLSLYSLVVLLIAFNMPIGIVAYGLDQKALRSLVADLLCEENIPHEWLGDTLRIQSMGIHGQVDSAGWMDVATFCSVGKEQNLMAWIQLEKQIIQRSHRLKSNGVMHGPLLVGAGLVLLCIAGTLLAYDLDRLQQTIAMLFES